MMKKMPKGEIKSNEEEEEVVDQIGPSSTLEEDEDKTPSTQDNQGQASHSQAQDQVLEQGSPSRTTA